MKPACECYSVTRARHSFHSAKDFVSLSPSDINGLLYGRGITNTVAASLTGGESCGAYSSAGQAEEELGFQVKNRISSSRGRVGWMPGLRQPLSQQLPMASASLQGEMWLPLYQPSRSDPAGHGSYAQDPCQGHVAEEQRLVADGVVARWKKRAFKQTETLF